MSLMICVGCAGCEDGTDTGAGIGRGEALCGGGGGDNELVICAGMFTVLSDVRGGEV